MRGRFHPITRFPRAASRNLLAALAIIALWAFSQAQEKTALSKWNKEIAAFEAQDKTNRPLQGAILFVGSSSIRLWKSLAQDFPGYSVINRGFGGSQIEDSLAFADRIIVPYNPKKVVLYAGDNDIASGKSPERVCEDFKAFEAKIRGALPKTKIAFISIKPSPSRWHWAEKQRTANRLIERHCQTDERLTYIDVFNPMLGSDGKPRPELFLEDNLHLNPKGYELWTSIIRPHLN